MKAGETLKTLGTRSRSAVGLPPGTLVFTGKRMVDKPRITVFDFDDIRYKETGLVDISECMEYKRKDTVTWINIDGLHDTKLLASIGEIFGLHPLVVEDIIQTDQRPKVEFFDDHIFIILKMLYFAKEDEGDGADEVISEQVSIVVGQNYVLSFQESVGDVFDPVRDRIRTGKGKVRKMGADYLAYALMDSIVDNYFVLLETFSDEMEALEDEILDRPSTQTVQTIHAIKRELVYIRKSTWPLREVINSLMRDEGGIITNETVQYLRDVHDHTIQVIETVETYRDLVSGMLDIYLSTLSNRMNEVMKVLTIIATIFIPLTFVAGIYGMNFDPASSPFNMPELTWRYGYPATIALMGLIVIVMLVYFRRKRWI